MRPDFTPIESENKANWDDRIDAIQHLSKVHSNLLRNAASDDYVLAYLEDDIKTEKFIIDMEDNSHAARALIERYSLGLDINDPNYRLKKLEIEKIAMSCSDTLKIVPNTILLLKRNKKDNFIVKLMGGIQEEETHAIEEEKKNFGSILTGLFKKRKKETEEEEI